MRLVTYIDNKGREHDAFLLRQARAEITHEHGGFSRERTHPEYAQLLVLKRGTDNVVTHEYVDACPQYGAVQPNGTRTVIDCFRDEAMPHPEDRSDV